MHRIAVLAFLVCALAPLPALATSVVPLTRAELASRSDTIVRARVGQRSTVRSEKTGRILTRSRLTVLATYKGAPGAQLELEQLGGTLAGATLVVPGDAALSSGEEAVLFLRCAGRERCHILGLGLGKYSVRTLPDGRKVAMRGFDGLEDASGRPLSAEPALPLEVLERELKGAKP